MCATSIGSTFSQMPVPGERKSGIPDGTEIPAPVSATTEPASRTSSARRSDVGAWATCPATSGCASRGRRRCPRLRVLAEPNMVAKPAFSASMPSSRSPLWETCLTCSTASGAWPPELARPRERGVEQLVVGDHPVDEAELVRVVGRDGVAGQVHLQRLGRAHEPRQALSAAEAGDDPEVDLGLAERRRVGGDADVAGHGELAPAPEREPVHRGDRHRARGPEGAQQRVAVVEQLPAAGLVHLVERLDVRPGAVEHRVGRGDDQRPDRVGGLDVLPELLRDRP